MALTFAIGVMLVLFLMYAHLHPDAPACVHCGKRIRHAPDCPTQKKRG